MSNKNKGPDIGYVVIGLFDVSPWMDGTPKQMVWREAVFDTPEAAREAWGEDHQPSDLVAIVGIAAE